MEAHPTAASPAFVGRAVEQAVVSAAIDSAVDGLACALLISGDAGVGKTALVERACSLRDLTVVVLSGGCLPLSAMTVPFLALRSALRSAESRADLSVGLMERGDVLAHDPIAFDQWLSDLCRERPVVLAIDDLHWADQSTLDVLMYVLAGPAERRLSVIATVRSGEVGGRHPYQHWVANVRRFPRIEELNLDPLDRMDTGEHVARLMDTAPHQSLVDEVFARTRGNAYLNRLLAQDLEPGARSVPADLPADLMSAVLQSWQILPTQTRDLTKILAAGGGPLTVSDLLTVSQLPIDLDDAHHSLMDAVETGVLDMIRDGFFWFHHPLIAEVLEENLSGEERVRWHSAFAARAEEIVEGALSPTPDMVIAAADHHDRALHVSEAYEWALQAADVAGSSGGTAEELRLLRRALDLRASLPGATESERDLLLRMMAAATGAGAHREELEAVERLLSGLDPQVDPLLTAELLVRGANLRFRVGRDFLLRDHYQKAVDLAAATDPKSWQHAYALASLAEECMWHSDPEAEALADRALVLARGTDNPLALSFALSAKASVLHARGQYEKCTHFAREAVAAAVEAHDFYAYFCGTVWELNAQPSRRIAAEHARLRREQLAQMGAPPADCAVLSAFEADGWFMIGDWRACQDRLREALGSDPGPLADVNARLTAARLAAWQGRTAEAQGHLARADELYADGSMYVPFAFDTSRATVALAAGDPEGALAAALAGATSPDVPNMGDWLMPLAAQALANLIEDDRCARRDSRGNLMRLDDLTQRFPSVIIKKTEVPVDEDLVILALEDLYQAEVGRARQHPANGDQWSRALTSCHAATLVWEEAYAAWRTAEALLSHGHSCREPAARVLRRGLTLAAELRAEPIRRALIALATSARIQVDSVEDVAASRLAELPGLTSREQEILAYIVAGRTYREIAHALTISEKTVSSHVSNVLRKTGAKNRIDLARLANQSAPVATAYEPAGLDRARDGHHHRR